MAVSEHSGSIQVIYAMPDVQSIVTLDWQAGMTAVQAVELSGLTARYPEIQQRALVLGVYGVQVDGQRELTPGDRVEICRPLNADPREMRRGFLAGGKVMGGKTEASEEVSHEAPK